MVAYIIGMVAIMLVVLAMTLYAITKGYAYKHTIDPKPEDAENGTNHQQTDKLDA
ncbi:YtzI protein [Virgibacillus halophilus]|uniref:YtzI protein n=1 Tax=Tigheibacillus halophilus TaxID=361280 RepID=A0ABU5C8Y0_9BACI|nr:YtzI protein [Virgibacillus halophilus]